MKKVLCASLVLAALAAPAKAATCAEGRQVIDEMSKIMTLSKAEQANLEGLISQAKLEEEQGREQKCKVILADAIRFFLAKTAIN
jgi:opacity protein-like surface antigen